MQKYIDDVQHRDVLDKTCSACNTLCDVFPTENDMKGSVVEVDAEFLYHVYELLLAYSHTYENYECTCGCMHEEQHC